MNNVTINFICLRNVNELFEKVKEIETIREDYLFDYRNSVERRIIQTSFALIYLYFDNRMNKTEFIVAFSDEEEKQEVVKKFFIELTNLIQDYI